MFSNEPDFGRKWKYIYINKHREPIGFVNEQGEPIGSVLEWGDDPEAIAFAMRILIGDQHLDVVKVDRVTDPKHPETVWTASGYPGRGTLRSASMT